MIFWIAVIAAVIVVLMLAICQLSNDDDDAEQEAWCREYVRMLEEDRQWQKRMNEMRDQRSRELKKQHEADNKKHEAEAEKPDGKPSHL